MPPNVCVGAEDVHSLSHSPAALNQALRDLRREILTVNGHVLPPVTSRRDLIHLLSQTLNSRTLTSFGTASSPKRDESIESGGEDMRRIESCPGMLDVKKLQHSPPSMLGEVSDGDIVVSSEYDSEHSAANPESTKMQRKLTGRKAETRRRRRRSFHLSTIDLLTRRILIAGSRTGMGGDAYFMV